MKRILIILVLVVAASSLATLITTNAKADRSVVYSSHYLTMRDSVKIAIDIYLPKELRAGERVPTLLHQTRYHRSYDLRWPASLFIDRIDPNIRRFVENGYAYISVDVRGSGASFGSRVQEWSPDEVRDGAEIVEWIIKQPWSNGKVGATGISYDGTAAEFLLVNKHPAVKAIVPRFCLFDAYTDIAFPGGIHHRVFTERWAQMNTALDRNEFGSTFLSGITKFAYKGVRNVQEDQSGSMLAAAIKGRTNNYDVHTSALRVTYRDDSNQSGITIDGMSPQTFHKEIEASGAPIYSYSGWYDAAYANAAIKRYSAVRTPGSKLTIGPWVHGGSQNISPFNSTKDQFDQVGEILRFFDYHLKEVGDGIKDEQPVRYYTMAEEKWKFAHTWPPPEARETYYYFAAQNSLSKEKPNLKAGKDAYRVDYTAGTGHQSRWNSLMYTDSAGFGYPNRNEQDEKLLTYTSGPLDRAIEVTGHPIITLFVSSTATDGNFFIYLEDVGEKGHITYVTEGTLRAIHRRLSDRQSPYRMAVPYRTFKHEDGMLLVPDQVAELTFDLLPVSYLFKRGHSIRIALAGADRDHFATPAGEPPTIQIYRNSNHASSIRLPVILR